MKLITTFSGLFAVLAVAIGVYFIFQNNSTQYSQTIEEGDFKIELTYLNSEEWEYSLTGNLPNPCYSTDVLTDSSNSEQSRRSILLYINPPLPEEICTQKIETVSYSDTFPGQPDDTFDLIIVENEAISNPTADLNRIPQYNFDSAEIITSGEYSLKVIYDRANNMWGYLANGSLPNECYRANVEIVIAESFPEQVSANLEISEPDTETICTQSIQDLQLTGEFSASEEALINFNVSEN